MAIIITIIAALLIMCYINFRLHENNFYHKTDDKILIFSHKNDIDRYGRRYFTKTYLQKS